MATFIRLVDYKTSEEKEQGFFDLKNRYETQQRDFKKIPGSPIAYWVSEKIKTLFAKSTKLFELAKPVQGLCTSNNDKYLRCWNEVNIIKIEFNSKSIAETKNRDKKWFPYIKGGDYRKWYGNNEHIVNWEHDGYEIRNFKNEKGKVLSRPQNTQFYFKDGITWSLISSSPSFRYFGKGMIIGHKGPGIFSNENHQKYLIGLCNSILSKVILNAISPALGFETGHISQLPLMVTEQLIENVNSITQETIRISKTDWDSFETSWDFQQLPLLGKNLDYPVEPGNDNILNLSIQIAYESYRRHCRQMTEEMRRLEEENNRIFIEAYGLQDEFTPEVPIEEITLFANPKYRYRGELTDDQLEARFKADTMKELLSYSIGCMMGRYSLDVPGLVYAHAENTGFDLSKYKTFPADEDGIIPITEQEWFEDDVACRFFRFIETSWDKNTLEANLDFIADSIGRKSTEQSREAIRRYFANDFYKDHCQTYKNRPIYWLFSSGKQKAFQAIVYLHRYNEGSLARMRTEYVLPLQSKIMRRMEHLEKDKDAAQGSAVNKIQKSMDLLRKHSEELKTFDEFLRHYADKKIKLDLDEGVKANYGKFGDLLADVKKIAASDKDAEGEDNE